MANYDFKTIEKKWQDRWEKEGTFRAIDDFSLPKFYGLIEFPYPSGAGMHVGHIKAYSGHGGGICRKRRMQGYNVLFPIGFDAFGLPDRELRDKDRHPSAHRSPIRTSTISPASSSASASRSTGASVVDTTDTELLQVDPVDIPQDVRARTRFPRQGVSSTTARAAKCVLSNEDSQGGKCDICHSDVVQKSKDVWYPAHN